MNPQDIAAQAIAERKCLRASYNGDLLIIAPHVLYTHHDAYFIDGVVLSRNDAPAKQVKMGMFKLTGLKKPALDEQAFTPIRKFQPYGAEFKGTVVASV
ncbi:MAG: hypothetical protein ACKOUT_14050 [Novosphingobium sp.]